MSDEKQQELQFSEFKFLLCGVDVVKQAFLELQELMGDQDGFGAFTLEIPGFTPVEVVNNLSNLQEVNTTIRVIDRFAKMRGLIKKRFKTEKWVRRAYRIAIELDEPENLAWVEIKLFAPINDSISALDTLKSAFLDLQKEKNILRTSKIECLVMLKTITDIVENEFP